MPRVFATKFLKERLAPAEFTTLRDEFLAWKAGDEYDHPIFGKDAGFRHPQIAVDEALRHVHLIPIHNPDGLELWQKAFHRRSRKTSDRILVYVSGLRDPEAYLFIDLFEDPNGHTYMTDSSLIEDLAHIAERFRNQY